MLVLPIKAAIERFSPNESILSINSFLIKTVKEMFSKSLRKTSLKKLILSKVEGFFTKNEPPLRHFIKGLKTDN